MFGLGFKSALAYCSSFYFIARKNSVERKYMMYEGEDVNTIDLLYEKETTEENGVKIIVPVNYYDRYDFIKKMKEQLAYFENVYFNVQNNDITNDFTIYRGEHFQSSTLYRNKELHLCLDNVYYPLDFKKLGIDKIDIPIGLRFGLNDGIFPIPNRESIKYSKETKEAILKKIGIIADLFVGKYNDSIKDSDNFENIISYYNSSCKYIDGFTPNSNYDITTILKFKTIPLSTPKLNGVKLLDIKDLVDKRHYLLNEYKIKYTLRNGTLRESKINWREDFNYTKIKKDVPIFIFTDRISGLTKEYIKDTYTSNDILFIKKQYPFKLGRIGRNSSYETYLTLCNLNRNNKADWRERIKEFQYVQSLFTSKFINLDSLVIPQDWLDKRKAAKDALKVKLVNSGLGRRVKLEGEISVKRADKLERYVSGKNCKFVPEVIKLSEFHKTKRLTVYGGQDDMELIDNLFTVFKRTSFFQLSERELKRLQDVKLHNLMPISEFMKGKNKVFKRIATAYLISQLINKYQNIFYRKERLKAVSLDLYNKLNDLETYKSKYDIYNADDETLKAILEIAKEHNLFDIPIKSLHDDVVRTIDRLPFLNPLFSEISRYGGNDDKLTEVICSLFKYYKQKINWDKYKKIVINDEISEESITEDVMKELMED